MAECPHRLVNNHPDKSCLFAQYRAKARGKQCWTEKMLIYHKEERRRKLRRAEKRGNGKFSICSKSPQKAATNWLYTKGAVGEETKPPHKVDHSLLNRVPQNPDRPTGPNRPPAAPTSYCSPAHARQSPGGGQTTYPLHPGGVFIQDSAGSSPFSRRCLFCVPTVRTYRPAGAFFIAFAETARRLLTTVRRCGTISDGNRIWHGKSLGKRCKTCRRSKTLRRPRRAGTKDGCGSGEAHCEDRRCKAATPNLSGKRTE